MPLLYVHVPFCVQKCDYCAFYSQALINTPKEHISLYLEGLEVEISKRQKDAPQGVSSLFIGGGTPTALKDGELEQLLRMIHQGFIANSGAEKTVEGNPGTLTIEKLTILQRYGINRFSLGVQSFDDRLLRAVGRVHTAGQAREAIRRLRAVGFMNINLDLMFGLPGQDIGSWQASLEEALSYSPEHLSLYGLMLEEGTPLYERDRGTVLASQEEGRFSDRGMVRASTRRCFDGLEHVNLLPDDDLQAQMYEWAVIRLNQAGYRQYETSNFALPGFECRHNLGYWRGADYLGIGPGGVSCINWVRWKNIEDVGSYATMLLKGLRPLDEAGQEVLTLRECMAELVVSTLSR